jgi:hypothetical protein
MSSIIDCWDTWLLADEVEDRLPEGAERRQIALGTRAAVAHEDSDDGLEAPLFRDERRERRESYHRRRRQLAGSRRGELPVRREHLVGLFGAPADQAAGHDWTDLVQPEREPSDDAEVAA